MDGYVFRNAATACQLCRHKHHLRILFGPDRGILAGAQSSDHFTGGGDARITTTRLRGLSRDRLRGPQRQLGSRRGALLTCSRHGPLAAPRGGSGSMSSATRKRLAMARTPKRSITAARCTVSRLRGSAAWRLVQSDISPRKLRLAPVCRRDSPETHRNGASLAIAVALQFPRLRSPP